MSETPNPLQQFESQPPKKKKRIFLWFFLAVQLLFIIWIFAGIGAAGEATDCGTLDQETCQAASDVGTGIGVILIIGLWMIVDFFLAVGYVIYRLAKRP
ncbi:hypothetical protein [Nocardioides marmoraquaticus]